MTDTVSIPQEDTKDMPATFFKYLGKCRLNVLYSLILSTVIILLGYSGIILRRHYSTDSYHLIDNQQAYWYLQNGRYTWWQLTMWLDQNHINLVLDQRPLLILAALSFIVSLSLLTLAFGYIAHLQQPLHILGINIALSLLFINVFVEEFMLFPEVAVSAATGFLFMSISATLLLRSTHWQYTLLSFSCLMIALGCYQSLIGYYLAITLIGGVLKTINEKGGKLKSSVIRWVEALIIAGISGVANIVIVKILITAGVIVDPGRGATTNIHTMLANVKSIVLYQIPLWWNADGLMAPGSMVIWMIIIISAIVIAKKHRINMPVIELILGVITAYVAAFAAHILERQIQLTPRSNMGFWAVQGTFIAVLIAMLFITPEHATNMNFNKQTKSVLNRAQSKVIPTDILVLLFTIMLFAFGVTINMQDISYDVYASNSLDKDYAMNVASKISEYQKKTGKMVTKIAITSDSHPQEKYRSTRYNNHELGRRIMNVDYANYQMINYLGGLNLEKTDFPSNLKRQYFGNKNWDTEDLQEQLVIKNDTAYLILY